MSKDQLPNAEYIRHLLTHISIEYEGRIIKQSDFLCFEFYGRDISIPISLIHTYPNIELEEQMKNMNINEEQFFHISSSTTWNIKDDPKENIDIYPVSNIGGLTDIYEKVMNILQKTKYQSM